MACELVTGHTGTPHVTAAQAAALNAGILGRDTCILDTGNKLAATMVTANSVRIDTGDAMIQGRQVSFPTSTELVLESGAQGLKRIDYVAIRYTKDPETEVEAAELVVLKGEASNSPQPPAVTTGNIDDGATLAEFPLWSITIDGITPKVPQLVAYRGTKLNSSISMNNRDLNDIKANGIYEGYKGIGHSPIDRDYTSIMQVRQYSDDWLEQTFTDIQMWETYRRVFRSGTKWSDWTMVASEKDDTIIARGKTGDWYWIKYASGCAECWIYTLSSTLTQKQTWGSMYMSQTFGSLQLPFAFIYTPTWITSCACYGANAWTVTENSGGAKTSPGLYFVRPTAFPEGGVKMLYNAHAIGRWK